MRIDPYEAKAEAILRLLPEGDHKRRGYIAEVLRSNAIETILDIASDVTDKHAFFITLKQRAHSIAKGVYHQPECPNCAFIKAALNRSEHYSSIDAAVARRPGWYGESK